MHMGKGGGDDEKMLRGLPKSYAEVGAPLKPLW